MLMPSYQRIAWFSMPPPKREPHRRWHLPATSVNSGVGFGRMRVRYIIILLLSLSSVVAADAPEASKPPEATKAEAAAIQEAIKNLGSADFDVREKANKELAAAGKKALPFLEAAQKSTTDA